MRTVLGQLDRLEAKAEVLTRVPLVAVILETDVTPAWAERLDHGRVVVLNMGFCFEILI